MKNTLRVVLALVLLTAVFSTQAVALGGRQGNGDVFFGQEIFANWDAAVRASAVAPDQLLKLTPLAYYAGIALYRIQGLDTGEVDYALVYVPVDPTAPPVEENEPLQNLSGDGQSQGLSNLSAAITQILPDSSRCTVTLYKDVNFSGPTFATNIDWSTFGSVYYPPTAALGQVNDTVSSIKTTCAPAYFYEHKAWSGQVLVIPANTNQSSLTSQSFNDKISSMWHALP